MCVWEWNAFKSSLFPWQKDVFTNLCSLTFPKFPHCLMILIQWFIWKTSGPHTTTFTPHTAVYLVHSFLNTSYNNIIFYVYEGFVSMYVCVLHGCLLPSEAIRGHLTPLNWSSRQFSVVMWALRIKPITLEEQPVLLAVEPSLHLYSPFI